MGKYINQAYFAYIIKEVIWCLITENIYMLMMITAGIY